MATTFTFDELWRGRSFTVRAGQPRKLQDAWCCTVDYSDVAAGLATPATRLQVGQAFAAYVPCYIGTPHRDWPSARCVGINPVCDDESPSSWTITADFEEAPPAPGFEPGAESGGGASPEPEDRDPIIEGDFRLEPYFDLQDLAGDPYLNSAEDLLENVPPKFKPIMILKWTRYYTSWSPDIGSAVIGKTNNDVWETYPANTVRIVGCPFKLINQKGRIVWKVDWTVEVDDVDGWIPTMVLDLGRNAISETTGTKVPVMSADGRPLAQPVMLDGFGLELPPGGTPVFLPFTNYGEISFDFLSA